MNVKHVLYPLLVLTLLNGCALPSYQHVYNTPRSISFKTGTYLVNYIDGDLSRGSMNSLTGKLMDELQELGGDSVFYIDSVYLAYVTPDRLTFAPSAEPLDLLSQTTGFDYLLNVRVLEHQSDLYGIMISSPGPREKSQSEVQIVVYDVHEGRKIYDQRIIASMEIDEDENDVHFGSSATGLVYKALRRGLKQMKKYAVK